MFSAFVSSFPLPRAAPTRRATCGARPRCVPKAGAESWDKAAAWEKTPQMPSKGVQEIEFIIKQDGTVEERVTGLRGKNCIKLTEKIEAALGRVTYTEKTEDYFETEYNTVQETQEVKNIVPPEDPLYVSDPNISSW
ncbi:unnamed protein product [Chondrus crispus]|uniref:DUF2997 domain-containing protein n=1 Tax=Chondrus crispus TaxID=2769 RepID=R7QL38_CHOCR|nr:unnamed protein product [Chondrus crispus]CDF38794.1 unnamed protein product [Chondrus crispus]|eukprot:XP_005718699.1 unnamed protein product [Chondrus crispus]